MFGGDGEVCLGALQGGPFCLRFGAVVRRAGQAEGPSPCGFRLRCTISFLQNRALAAGEMTGFADAKT